MGSFEMSIRDCQYVDQKRKRTRTRERERERERENIILPVWKVFDVVQRERKERRIVT